MDVSQELLIDVGLNLVGYLAAGFLLILIYSLFKKSRNPKVAGQLSQSEISCPTPSDMKVVPTAEPASDSSVEFIKLGSAEINVDKPARPTVRPPKITEDYRRNRLKIITTARQMLNAGTPENKVKSLLPISEAELSLLLIGKG